MTDLSININTIKSDYIYINPVNGKMLLIHLLDNLLLKQYQGEILNDILSDTLIISNNNESSKFDLLNNYKKNSFEKYINYPKNKPIINSKFNKNNDFEEKSIKIQKIQTIINQKEKKEKIFINYNKKELIMKFDIYDNKKSKKKYKQICNNMNELDFINYYIKMKNKDKIYILSFPISKKIWFKGKIKKIKILNNEIYQFYNENYNILLMTAIKNSKKNFTIFDDEFFLNKCGKITVNFLGNLFKIYMNNNDSNNCKIKYVIFYLYIL